MKLELVRHGFAAREKGQRDSSVSWAGRRSGSILLINHNRVEAQLQRLGEKRILFAASRFSRVHQQHHAIHMRECAPPRRRIGMAGEADEC